MDRNTPQTTPPKLSDRFLEWYCHPDFIEEIQGDLYERFQKQVRERGIPYARLMFAWNVLRFFRPSCIKSFQPLTSTIMWNNYLKMGFRNIVKHYGVALLNIFGLTIGLATCFIILLWVGDELSVDRYHENGPELYQVMRNMKANGEIFTTSAAPQPMAEELVEKYPEVVRTSVFSWEEEAVITYKDKTLRERGRFAGKSFFEMFSHPLLIGNPKKALEDPANVLVSETLAQKLFGPNWQKENLALGQVIELNIDTFRAFTVAGVFEDIPPNSRQHFDLVLSEEVFNVRNSWVGEWDNNRYRLFVQLRPGTDLDHFNQRIKSLIREHVPEEQVDVFLQKYEEGYLYGDFYEGKVTGGRIEYVRIFLVVALFIFLIACINFMNLSTAQSSIRAKEIGIRKTIGARKGQIISQFISESVLLALLSLVLSGILVMILLPGFNELTGKELVVDFFDPKLLLAAVGLSLFMGILAGSYPAFVLSSLKETHILKGVLLPKSRASSVRKGLVIFQFFMSNVLILSTFATYKQISYIRQKKLGYDKEHIVYFPIEGALREKRDLLDEKLLKHPDIVKVTAGWQAPTNVFTSTGGMQWEGKDPDLPTEVNILGVDYGYVETFNLAVIEGRSHSPEFSLDSANVLVNEAAAKLMGMDSPVGESVYLWGRDGKIIGLMKDFHFSSMYDPIDPLVLRLDSHTPMTYFVKLSGENSEKTLAHIEKVYGEINPHFPFTFNFLDQTYEDTYRSEVIIGRLAGIFSLIAILISCLGLFALAAFASERRLKEIGIRKILGASESGLAFLLNKEFIVLVVVAFVLAAPLSWYILSLWLKKYTYHFHMGWEMFLAAGLLTLVIALLTTSFQTLRVIFTNPITVLSKE